MKRTTKQLDTVVKIVRNGGTITKRGPYRRRTDRQLAEDETWKWCSLFVRERDGWKCVMPGCHRSRENGSVMQAGHVFTRGAKAIKYDADRNIFCQCKYHNMKTSQDQTPYHDWYIAKFGQAAFDELKLKKGMTCKRSISDLELIAADYKRKYEELKGTNNA